MLAKFGNKDLIGSGAAWDIYKAIDLDSSSKIIIKECYKFRLKKLKSFFKLDGLDIIHNEIRILKELGVLNLFK
jgi:hypothetical protein